MTGPLSIREIRRRPAAPGLGVWLIIRSSVPLALRGVGRKTGLTRLDPNRSPAARQRFREGFTIIELLVVIVIIMILTVITVATVNFAFDSERIHSAARQVQSYLEGARDRAIYAKQSRGVRFLVDETNPRASSSMVFVGPTEPWTEGTLLLQLESITSGPVKRLRGFGTGWFRLRQKGLLTNGARIKIPRDDSGSWYTVIVTEDDNGNGMLDAGEDTNANGMLDDYLTPATELMLLSTPYRDPLAIDESTGLPAGGTVNVKTYQIELPATVLPNQEPVLLPRNIVIDLDRSVIPGAWKRAGPVPYSSHMDVLFSPRGTVTGVAASRGLIHFVLAENIDADAGLPLDAPPRADSTTYQVGDVVQPAVPSGFYFQSLAMGNSASSQPAGFTNADTGDVVTDGGVQWLAFQKHDNVIVTLFTRTGNISSHPVFRGFPLDPFRYAETGEVAK